MSFDPERALALVREAAVEAGELLLRYRGRLDPARTRSKSARRDLQTEADLASERLLVERIRAAFPDHAIEAEEEVRDALDERPRWFLDPLDGTINFVHGLPFFAVSIGLFVAGEPTLAVVHLPVLDETFHAIAGRGAFLGDDPISVSDQRDLADAILVTGFPYRRNELQDNNLENFAGFFPDVRGLRRTGSAACDLAYTAAGRFDAFWELHLGPHDMAAGALLVREAGGIVTDPHGGQDWLRSGHIVAAGPGLHGQVRPRVRTARA
ncbi:MAG TPA: inositol monophosphatase [Planctomycetes bacterium]|nr:inositol monophosphatase [Planctomycetota bacterium]